MDETCAICTALLDGEDPIVDTCAWCYEDQPTPDTFQERVDEWIDYNRWIMQ